MTETDRRGLPRTVLIANRGEIAARIARTCRSLGIRTVAVASDADADALHTRVCDEVVRLPGAAPADTYLRIDLLLDAARRTGADAVHPGYGFLAESPVFASAVIAAGLTWIGPAPDTIATMGDKLAAKQRMAAAGVPVLPGAELTAELDDDAILGLADQVGYPLLVKATAGGGGKGMREVHTASGLLEAVAAARREAGGAFGDDRVFLERLVDRPRHLEVQVFGDAHGTVVHLFERECSVQRRHQKVVEESPAPGITPAVRAALCDAAAAAATALGYVNAGTVEFVGDEAVLERLRAGDADVDPRDAFAFLEVNTRLQVEHPVTEEVVRVRDRATGGLAAPDLVRLQLLVAAGEPLPFTQDQLVQDGHAIEVRLYAEDPAAGHLPTTGTLHAFTPATGPGVRWEAGIAAGDEVTPYYDPMLAKVIAQADTRAEAAGRLAAALDRTALTGLTTNRDLLVAVLRDAAFLAGDTTTAFLAERFPDGVAGDATPVAAEVTLAAAIAALHATSLAQAARPVLTTLPPGFTSHGTFPVQHAYDVIGTAPAGGVSSHDPERDTDGAAVGGVGTPARTVRLRPAPDGSTAVEVCTGVAAGFLDPDAEVVAMLTAHVRSVAEHHLDVEVDGRRLRPTVLPDTDGRVQVTIGAGRVTLAPVPRFPAGGEREVAGATRTPMPGSVVTVAVAVGDEVAAGDLLVTVEAMKMEHRVTAAVAGTVVEVRVAPGEQVTADAVLVVVGDPLAVDA